MRKPLSAIIAGLALTADGDPARGQGAGPACVKRSELIRHLAMEAP